MLQSIIRTLRLVITGVMGVSIYVCIHVPPLLVNILLLLIEPDLKGLLPTRSDTLAAHSKQGCQEGNFPTEIWTQPKQGASGDATIADAPASTWRLSAAVSISRNGPAAGHANGTFIT